jgi:hypothetical protein
MGPPSLAHSSGAGQSGASQNEAGSGEARLGNAGLGNTGLRDTGLRDTGLRDTGLRHNGLRHNGLRDADPGKARPGKAVVFTSVRGPAHLTALAPPVPGPPPPDEDRPELVAPAPPPGAGAPAPGARYAWPLVPAPAVVAPFRAPAPPPGAGAPAPGARYAWPLVPAPAVVTPFRAPAHPYGPGHRGVDLAGSPLQPVVAARGGMVVFAGPVGGRDLVSVQHDDGLRTTYEPLQPMVRAGAVVLPGEVIGLLQPGHAGCAAPACLHWGVRRDRADYLDPLVLLRPLRVRLLPVPVPWPAAE